MTHPNLRQILHILFSQKAWTKDYQKAPDSYVAAGNPTNSVALPPYDMPLYLDTDQEQTLTVAGNSMAPRGIYNGDRLTYRKDAQQEIRRGDFLIIEVDNDFYTHEDPKANSNINFAAPLQKFP